MIQLPSQQIAQELKPSVIFIGLLVVAGALTACEKQPSSAPNNTAETAVVDEDTKTKPIANTQQSDSHQDASKAQDVGSAETASTRDTKLDINWQQIDSGVQPIDKHHFDYPFKLDSDSVKSQADFSDISNEQAQYSLTVGMASNEPLEAIIDQLGDSYLSHTFSEKDATLYVYTTPNVTPCHYDYVIAHDFAKGLTLPIEVMPRPKADNTNSDTDTHNNTNTSSH